MTSSPQIVMTYERYRNALMSELVKRKELMGQFPPPAVENHQQTTALSQNLETIL